MMTQHTTPTEPDPVAKPRYRKTTRLGAPAETPPAPLPWHRPRGAKLTNDKPDPMVARIVLTALGFGLLGILSDGFGRFLLALTVVAVLAGAVGAVASPPLGALTGWLASGVWYNAIQNQKAARWRARARRT